MGEGTNVSWTSLRVSVYVNEEASEVGLMRMRSLLIARPLSSRHVWAREVGLFEGPGGEVEFKGRLSRMSGATGGATGSARKRLLKEEDMTKVEFETSEEVDVTPTFDTMGLREDLLRGIYAYGTRGGWVGRAQGPGRSAVWAAYASGHPANI